MIPSVDAGFTFNWGAARQPAPVSIMLGSLQVAGGHAPSDAVLDLVDVISAVHYADCAQRRPGGARADVNWSRSLRLRIGLRCPERWSDPAVQGRLASLLATLTDDEWELQFGRRATVDDGCTPVRIDGLGHQEADAVALFSGGLDSLCGWISDRSHGMELLGLSVETNGRLARCQQDLAYACGSRWAHRPARVRLPFHLHRHRPRESSQRSRGFAFLGLACATASIVRSSSVRVYENGIGSMNLPYTAAQVGARATRATRPATLQFASELFGLVLGHDVRISNPNLFNTKSGMCSELPEEAHDVVPKTESCDTAFSRRLQGPPSCGTCASCLLRRQALASAGLAHLDPPSRYRQDVFLGDVDSDLYTLKAMLSQAAHIDAVLSAEGPGSWERLVGEYPDLVCIAGAMAGGLTRSRAAIIEMYRTYVGEWRRVPCPVVRQYLPVIQ